MNDGADIPKRPDLAETGRELRVAVDELSYAVSGLGARVARNRKAVAWIATSLLVDVILTVVVSVGLANQLALAEQQRVITSEALCPLYNLFITAYHPELQKPEKLAEYNHGFDVIRAGAVSLRCATGS